MLDDDGGDPRPLTAGAGELPRIALDPSLMDKLTAALERVAKLLDEDSMRALRHSVNNISVASDGLKEIPPILASLHRLLNDNNIERVEGLLVHLDNAAAETKPLAQEVRALVNSFHSVSQRIEHLGAETSSDTLPRVNSVLNDLEQSTRQLNRVLQQLDEAPESLLFGRNPPPPGPGERGYVPPR